VSDDIRPNVDAKTGVPFCAESDCPLYDGKRCRAMGFRPSNICEPAVMDLVSEITTQRAALERAQGVATRFSLPHNTDAQLWVRDAGRYVLGEASIIGDYIAATERA